MEGKTSKKIIAIATSDWHLYKFKKFDTDGSRLTKAIDAANNIFVLAESLEVPILFAGDLFHNPKEVENETNTLIQNLFRKWPHVKFYYISGNHDFSQKNTSDNKSPSHMDSLGLNTSLSEVPIKEKNFRLYGIDYQNNPQDLNNAIKNLKPKKNKNNILLLHTDWPGAKTPQGLELDEATVFNKTSYKLFRKFKLVLFGHIHKPQQLFLNGYMLGSPWHQTAGDAGTQMGVWLIYGDFTMTMVPIELMPKFIKLKKGEVPNNDIDYFIPHEELDLGTLESDVQSINVNDRKTLIKLFCKAEGIKKKKRNFLLNLLSSVE